MSKKKRGSLATEHHQNARSPKQTVETIAHDVAVTEYDSINAESAYANVGNLNPQLNRQEQRMTYNPVTLQKEHVIEKNKQMINSQASPRFKI